jgi:two-component system cell cycle response regulator
VHPSPRILLIDPSDGARKVLAERLHLQGFVVIECKDGAEGAVRALEEPPAAVVADLSMPSISGVQLCRLLKSESSTSATPVILRGAEGRRNHFWAEQAGAFAYVIKGRMGELVRALRRAIERPRNEPEDGFFVVSSTEGLDVRERIAAHLDAALFDSVIAAEVRRLGSSESFDRLLDLLSQFVSQVTTYRWLAISRAAPARFGVHANASCAHTALVEARTTLGLPDTIATMTVEDEDAVADASGPPAICAPLVFGDTELGTLALAPRAPVHPNDPLLVKSIARELGGALRMATLVEESRFMATTDALTGLMNRRAFMDWAVRDVRRSQRYRDPFSVIMIDVDHFKQINDKRGHTAGDIVLASVGKLLGSTLRSCDVVARWGGEEFVIALPSTALGGGLEVAERARLELENANILDPRRERVPVTASLGVAQLIDGESIEQLVDRADRAMYAAKSAGRNRVASTSETTLLPAHVSIGPKVAAEA